jgi:acetate CoA/acetoacetate CoA-transferase alpha subunit
MAKIITIEEAMDFIHDGITLMIGGFWAVGTPERIIDAIVAKGVKNLTCLGISTATPEKGMGKLIANRQLKKFIGSYIGRNPLTMEQFDAGELEIEFCPQGTLSERIRAGGFGLGGILTPTGVGTEVAIGKQVINVDGRDYLLEKPLKADVAILKAHKADKAGNLVYRKAARNTNPLMAAAAKITIAQADHIFEIGQLDPDEVMTPGVFVDYLVQN